jgi:hypothetical protein
MVELLAYLTCLQAVVSCRDVAACMGQLPVCGAAYRAALPACLLCLVVGPAFMCEYCYHLALGDCPGLGLLGDGDGLSFGGGGMMDPWRNCMIRLRGWHGGLVGREEAVCVWG